MELMTKTLEARFKQVGSQEDINDPMIIAHYFNPCGGGDWYVTEYDPQEHIFFGYARIFYDHNDEWGYVSLDELRSYKGPLNLGIERDLFWQEKRASQVIPDFKGFRS